jgi:hypothetical protein
MTDAIGINSATRKWSPQVLSANHSYDSSCRSLHLVQSQYEIHLMINYFTDITLANSDDGLYLESTLRNQNRTELRVDAPINPNSNSITIPNRHYTATGPR